MRTLVIANGELSLYDDAAPAPRLITSPFAREVVERDERSRRHTSWKHAPREASSGVIPANALWGRGAQGKAMAPPRFLFACFGADEDTVYYVMRIGEAVGLLRQHLAEGREVRLFHKTGILVLGLAFQPSERRLLMAMGKPDGTAQIEVYDEEGNRKGAVTDGDSIDAAPAFVPVSASGTTSNFVFQSSGVARHPEHGHVAGIGHAIVCRLDYKTGEMQTVLDDAQHDFLAPRIAADGTLYAIRRPVDKPAREKAGGALRDTLLFPWRLLKAVFGYLNFFSMIYGKEPLRSAGGPRTPELDQDLGKLWLHGRLIELSKVRDDPQYAGNLVPASWVLVRVKDGKHEIVARHVAGFSLAADGSVIYTNGYDVTHWRDGVAPRKLGRQELVEGLCAA